MSRLNFIHFFCQDLQEAKQNAFINMHRLAPNQFMSSPFWRGRDFNLFLFIYLSIHYFSSVLQLSHFNFLQNLFFYSVFQVGPFKVLHLVFFSKMQKSKCQYFSTRPVMFYLQMVLGMVLTRESSEANRALERLLPSMFPDMT